MAMQGLGFTADDVFDDIMHGMSEAILKIGALWGVNILEINKCAINPRALDVLVKKHPEVPAWCIEHLVKAAAIIEEDRGARGSGEFLGTMHSRGEAIRVASFYLGLCHGTAEGILWAGIPMVDGEVKSFSQKGTDTRYEPNRNAKLALFKLLDANPPRPRGKAQLARNISKHGIHIGDRNIRIADSTAQKWINEWEKQRGAGAVQTHDAGGNK